MATYKFEPLAPGAYALFVGDGSPEGVVTAGVGAHYFRTDGTTATGVLYRKVTGTGNTGWRSIDARTLRTGGFLPSGAFMENVPRYTVISNTLAALTSGTMRMIGRFYIPGGQPLSSVSILSGATAGASLTHSFVSIHDASTLALLTTTEDVTTAAWGSQTVRTWNIATALRGATPGGTYTPTDLVEVYAALTVIGTTMPTLSGTTTGGTAGGLAPKLFADSTAGLTGLADVPDTAAALGSEFTGLPWGYFS